jgi:hypothetical protein
VKCYWGAPLADHIKNFETTRTLQFRATNLHPTDEGTIDAIEEHGCFILSVGPACKDNSSWTYSIGIFDTCGQPDLITVDLPYKTANVCLNEAAKLLRSGVDLTKGRHAGLLTNVDCEFRSVDPKWVKHLMNWANWYYAGTDYPVLQVIYPDLENRFPEDEGFNQRFSQPLMQPDTPFTERESDFWDSIDESSKFKDWKFPDKPHTKAFVSKTVNDGTEAITYVSHDLDDGAWQFLGDSMSNGEGPVLVCLHHPTDNDPSLIELADLPLGWWAERDASGEPWVRHQHEPEEAES